MSSIFGKRQVVFEIIVIHTWTGSKVESDYVTYHASY